MRGRSPRTGPAGDSYGERPLLAHVAGQLTFEGTARRTRVELSHRALAGGELINQETADGMSWAVAMGALGWCDDFDTFEAMHRLVLEDARRRGSVIGFATAIYGLSFTHYYRGRLADAVADAEQAIAAESAGRRHFLTAARAQLAWALIELGELEHATAELQRAHADAAYERSSTQALVLEARAKIELLRGRPELALQTALDAGRVAAEARIPNPSLIPWCRQAALAAGAIVDRDRAEALLHEELELVRRFGAPRPIGVTLTAAGVVRGAEGARSARGDGREAGRLAASRVRPPSRRTTGAEALTPAERRVAGRAG